MEPRFLFYAAPPEAAVTNSRIDSFKGKRRIGAAEAK
jgi:hypothetical protein